MELHRGTFQHGLFFTDRICLTRTPQIHHLRPDLASRPREGLDTQDDTGDEVVGNRTWKCLSERKNSATKPECLQQCCYFQAGITGRVREDSFACKTVRCKEWGLADSPNSGYQADKHIPAVDLKPPGFSLLYKIYEDTKHGFFQSGPSSGSQLHFFEILKNVRNGL